MLNCRNPKALKTLFFGHWIMASSIVFRLTIYSMHFFTERGGKSIVLLLFGVVVFSCQSILAADRYFTNVLGGDFTNKTLWMTGVVPTVADNANFTNNVARKIDFTINATNANVFFNTVLGSTYTQNIGSATWYVTNQYMLGQNASTTGTVTQISGTLVVTNAGGTASIVIGNTGVGTFNLEGGTVIVDNLFVTNKVNSTFNFDAGTLISSGTTWDTNSTGAFKVGNVAGQTATLILLSGSHVFSRDFDIGNIAGNTGLVYLTSGAFVTNKLGDFNIGSNSSFNSITISNGATLWNTGGEIYIGASGGAVSNRFIVDGGTVTNSGGGLWVGYNSGGNFAAITNGGEYINAGGSFGLEVGGAGSGGNTSNNLFIVSTGSKFRTIHSTAIGSDGGSNRAVVTGAGTIFESTVPISVGVNTGGSNSVLEVRNGALFSNFWLNIGRSGADGNTVIISDSGTIFTNTSNFIIGGSSSFNDTAIVTNGGALYADLFVVSSNSSTGNNELLVSGLGSIASAIAVASGSNANTSSSLGSGFIQINDRGTLEVRSSITNGFAGLGNISNVGGIYQFTTTAPTIQTNAGGTIVLSNGWISYRNVQNAPVYVTNQLSKLEFTGTNSFILNNATNALFTGYTFTNGLGSTNWMNLVLMNGNTRWQATNTLIGATSTMLITNTLATTFGTITNAGTIQIADNSTLTNEGKLVITGNGVGGAGAVVNLAGTNSISGPLLLGGNATISTPLDQLTLLGTLTNSGFQLTVTNSGSSTLIISSTLQGTGGLVHNGTGTLELSANNANFSGTITNNVGGTIQSDSANGLGTGNVVINGGVLHFTNADQTYIQTFTMNGASTNMVDSGITVVIGNAANDITGSGLIVKQGAGTLFLTNSPNSSFSGGFRVDDGILAVADANGLGTGTLTMNGGELDMVQNAFIFSNSFNVTATSIIDGMNGSDLSLYGPNITSTAGTTLILTNETGASVLFFRTNNFTYDGDIQFATNTFAIRFLHNTGTNTINGHITGTGSTLKNTGGGLGGTVILNNSNSYTALTALTNGMIIVTSNAALGAVGAGSGTIVSNTAALAFAGGFNYDATEDVSIWAGTSTRGNLINLSGTNTFAGTITNASSTLYTTEAGTLILRGAIQSGGNLLVVSNVGSSALVFSNIYSGAGGISKYGSGTLTLAGLNTFSGPVTNNLGTIAVNSPTGLGLTTSVILNGGTLLFNSSMTNTSAAVVLNGGTISEVDTNVSLGAMTVSANSIVSLTSGGAVGRMTFASGTNTVGSGAKLTIYGWSWNSALSGGSDDLIFFTNTSFETASFLNNVTFFGTGGGARVLSSGELVPITPEPNTVISALGVLGLALRHLLRYSRKPKHH